MQFRLHAATLVSALFLINCLSAQIESSKPLQNFCGTQVPDQQWETEFSRLVQELNQLQASGKSQAGPFTIPVIIHVIHGGQPVGTYPNLAQGQLVSQIQTLNSDYGGAGYNSWNYPVSSFSTWAVNQVLPSASLDALGRIKIANCNVQFCLATKDTLGNTLAEPGIDRVNYVSRGWTNPASISGITTFQNYVNGTIKPGTIWNVSRYLNIWLTDENISATNGLLGYATFPPLTSGLSGLNSNLGTNTTDGFWCYAMAFGSITYYPSGTYYTGYDRGRTSTHEIGHWLGLRHIWGDASCATDYCNDTPPANASNFNAPAYPYHSGTCSGNTPNGEMFMNFMDYTNDPVKYMYTTDQATRVQTAMSSSPYRKFLGTHNLCSVAAIAPTASFNIGTTACASAVITLSNMTNGTPIPSYTWSTNGPGSANFFPNNNSALTVTFPTPGTYTVTLTANNGSISSTTKVITIGVSPSLTLSTPQLTVCTDDIVILSGDGANSYAWQPGAQLGSLVYYSGMTSQVYTCVATGVGNCKTTATISVDVTDCTGLNKLSQQQNFASIYPNPASDKLVVKLLSATDTEARIEITDALGRHLMTQYCSFKHNHGDVPVNISSLSQGMYVVKLITTEGKQQVFRLVKGE